MPRLTITLLHRMNNSWRMPWILLLSYFLFVSFTAVSFIPPTWDEYLDFSGCVAAVNHFFAVIRGQPTDITTFTYDLEWYGNSYLFPAYILWAITSRFPVEIPEGPETYDSFLASPFSACIHLLAAFYGCIAVYLFAKILTRLEVKLTLLVFSVSLFALSPFWLANSFWNLKDLPVSIPFLGVIYLTLGLTPSGLSYIYRTLCVAFLLGTVLANKYAYAPLVLILSFVHSFRYFLLSSGLHSLKPCRSKFKAVIKSFSCVFMGSILLSFLMTPQAYANLSYPIQSLSYFASHPAVTFDHTLSLVFFSSRGSRLLSPALIMLVMIAFLGLTTKWWVFIQVNLSRFPSSHQNKTLIYLFAIVPTAFYLVPILVSGRVFYGPDLRHIIWLYPPVLLALTLLAQQCMCMVAPLASRILAIMMFVSLSVTAVEVLAIYPHYYSYLGMFPVGSTEKVESRNLVLSRYNPSYTPEMQPEMLRQYFLHSVGRLEGSHDVDRYPPKELVTQLSSPINPSYLDSYLRMHDTPPSLTNLSLLNYKLRLTSEGVCDSILFTKKAPQLYANAKICVPMSR